MRVSPQNLLRLAGVAVAAFGAVYLYRKGVVGTAKAVAEGAAYVAKEAAAGTVIGIGKAVGIPETNQSECARALAEGRTWDASMQCPAGTFISSWFGQTPPAQLNGAECGCRSGLSNEALISAAGLALALYVHTTNKRKHRA